MNKLLRHMLLNALGYSLLFYAHGLEDMKTRILIQLFCLGIFLQALIWSKK